MIAISVISVFLLSGESLAFDPNTGELIKDAKCSEYHKKMDGLISYLNSPRLSDEDAKPKREEARKLQEQAKAKGCNPYPWGVTAGKFNPAKTITKESFTFVPSSQREAGVPMNFDFIGIIGTRIGELFQKLGGGNIFPAVKEVAGAAGVGK